MDTGGITIKVNTASLQEASSEVRNMTSRMRGAFDEIEAQIRSSTDYWEGEGNTSYLRGFLAKKERMQTIVNRFEENATDLERMAGIYDTAERNNDEMANALPDEVIF